MWLFGSWVGWDRKFHLYLSDWWSRLSTSLTKLKNRTQIIVSITWFYFCYQYRHRGLSSPIFHTPRTVFRIHKPNDCANPGASNNTGTIKSLAVIILQNHQVPYLLVMAEFIILCITLYRMLLLCEGLHKFFFFLVFKCSEDLKKQRTGMWSRCNFQTSVWSWLFWHLGFWNHSDTRLILVFGLYILKLFVNFISSVTSNAISRWCLCKAFAHPLLFPYGPDKTTQTSYSNCPNFYPMEPHRAPQPWQTISKAHTLLLLDSKKLLLSILSQTLRSNVTQSFPVTVEDLLPQENEKI